jgi:hypothetical protein
MLSDDYWSYVVAKVAAQLSMNKLKTLLHPTPVTQWWFQRLVTWATMDILAVKPNDDWPPLFEGLNCEDMEVIYASWVTTPRRLADNDRIQAAQIRAQLGMPTFSKNQTQLGTLMIAKLNFWVGKYLPKMHAFLGENSRVGYDVASHPFWASKLRWQLMAHWSAIPLAGTGRNGIVEFMNEPTLKYAKKQPATFFETNFRFEPKRWRNKPFE